MTDPAGSPPWRRAPRAAVALAAVAVALLAAPLVGLAVKAPWSSLGRELATPEARVALRLSLVCATSAAALAALVGFPLAWVLARGRGPWIAALRAAVALPLVLPPVVGGVALLLAFGRRGLVGRWLADAFGIRLAFTTPGAILAETFVALPFLVLAAEAALRAVDPDAEALGRSLGGGPWRTLRLVVLPRARGGLLAGLALAWARALGEFGATITFAGSTPGRTQTLPLQVYLLLEGGRLDAAVALSLVLVAASVAVLAGLRAAPLGRRAVAGARR